MEQSCERAVKIGLSALAFTDHLDFTGWQVDASDISGGSQHFKAFTTPENTLVPPLLVLNLWESEEHSAAALIFSEAGS
jgi:histidinol-phosphatase (PHP family)